jgi:hypothetical protein
METADLFQEDASLKSEYWETFSPKRELEPEKRLLLAVLDNGIRCYRQYLFTQSRRFFEAEEWLFGDNEQPPISFGYICDVFGLSPACIRGMLLGWKTAKRPPRAGRRLFPPRGERTIRARRPGDARKAFNA